jgi:small subunit ribosomal protein S17
MSTAKPAAGKGKTTSSDAPKTPRTTRTAKTEKAEKVEKTAAAPKAPRAPRVKKPAATTVTAPAEQRSRRQQKTGRVVSNKMQKTIVVAVETLKRHPLYKRTYKSTNKFKAHDEHNDALPGDLVRIEETRPISKDKRWRLVEVVKRAAQAPSVAQVVSQLDPQTTETEER